MGSASAATWTGGGADANWTTPENWAGAVAPVSPEALEFAGAQTANSNDFVANTRFNGITFLSGASGFTLSGSDIDLGGNVVNASGSGQTLGLGLRLLQDTTFDLGGQNMTVNAVVSDGGDAFGLTKTGTGILYLRRSNTYTGTTVVRRGVLNLDLNATGTPERDMIAPDSVLSMGGDAHNTQVTMAGQSQRASVQTFNGLMLGAGRASLPVSRNGTTGSMTVGLGALSRSAGAFLAVALPASGGINVDPATPLQHGILGAWATVGTDWLTHSGGVLGAYGGYVELVGTDPVLPDDPVANVTFGAASSGDVSAVGGLTDIHTLRFTETVSRNVVVGDGNMLRLGTAGCIWRATSATAAQTLFVQDGTLTAGGATDAPGELILNVGGATGSADSRSNVALRVSSAILDNGGGSVRVTKLGPQIAILSGANAYSGDTFVLQGQLRASAPGRLGTGSVHVFNDAGLTSDHGSVYLDGTGTYQNDFVLAGLGPDTKYGTVIYSNGALLFGGTGARVGGTVTLKAATRIGTDGSGTGHLDGRITGDAALQFFSTGYPNGTCLIGLNNPGNDWTGNTTLNVNGTSTASRTLRLGASEVIPNGLGKGSVILQNGSSSGGANLILALNGNDETINGLGWAGRADRAGNRIIQNGSASTASTLTLGDGDASDEYLGVVRNGSTGTLAVRKIGAGKQVFSGACSHTGGTVVDGGTLEVSGSLTGGTVAVDGGMFLYSGETALGRNATVDGGVFAYTSAADYAGALTHAAGGIAGTNWKGNLDGLTINTGRWIAPGTSVGEAVTGNQAWSNGGTYEFEIADAAGVAGAGWDTVTGTGTLDLSGLTEAGGFTVKVASLDLAGAAGPCVNFDPKELYVWVIATFANISGAFNSGSFLVDASAFANEASGSFRVVRDGTALLLQYSPANGTLILLR